MTDLEKAIEAMRTRTTDDGHIAAVENLVAASSAVLKLLARRGYCSSKPVKALREALAGDSPVTPYFWP